MAECKPHDFVCVKCGKRHLVFDQGHVEFEDAPQEQAATAIKTQIANRNLCRNCGHPLTSSQCGFCGGGQSNGEAEKRKHEPPKPKDDLEIRVSLLETDK